MVSPMQGPTRERLERLSAEEVDRLVDAGVLITDARRRRPLYFDGRFLTAADLTREQGYMLTRFADLGRAQGFGAITGLTVEAATSSRLRIEAGHGITPAGELVMLSSPLDVDVTDLGASQRLDAAFGLREKPRPPARNLTGLFVVGLRAVEFTANPIASYPTSVNGPRSVEDGDIVEATAVTLVPYASPASNMTASQQRSQVAREVFLEGSARGMPADVLPLAMVSLERGIVSWVDEYLVRRDAGAERQDVLGLGFAPRALREAHALQYARHLQEVLEVSSQPRRFAATQHFSVLPPAGRLPSAAVDVPAFTQAFFPPAISVDISVMPADELPALLEDSLLLPPIDLSLAPDEQESTSVLVLVPVPRPMLRTLMTQLSSQTRALPPAAPGLVAKQRPLETLRALRVPRPVEPVLRAEAPADAAWRRALSSTDMLWYVRRRNIAYRAEVTGIALPIGGDDVETETLLRDRLTNEGLTDRFETLRARTTAVAGADLVNLLASPKFETSPTLRRGALEELEAVETLDKASVQAVVERFSETGSGEGLARLESETPALVEPEVSAVVSSTMLVPELDALARRLARPQLRELSDEIVEAARANQPERVRDVIERRRLRSIER